MRFLIEIIAVSMIYSQLKVKTLLIMFKSQFSIGAFFTNFKMKIFISKLVVGNTHFWALL